MLNRLFKKTSTPIVIDAETSNKDEQIQVSADQLNAVVEQLKIATTTITSLSEQNQESVQYLSSQSEASKNYAEHITQKIQSVEQSSVQVATNAEQMLAQSNYSLEDLQTALQRVHFLEMKIEALESMHTQLQQQMERLVEHSNQTKKIVQTIGDISNKTKILSLNASIEAARAGEHGKGFNVVANEVGNLANLTSKAVVETAANLTLMEQEITLSSSIVSDESTAVEESVHEIRNVMESFILLQNRVHEIQQSIHNTNDEVSLQRDQMCESVSLLKEITEMVSSNMTLADGLKETMYQQHHEVIDVTHMMGTLSNTSNELQQLVQITTNGVEDYQIDHDLVEEMCEQLKKLARGTQLEDLDSKTHEAVLLRFAASVSSVEAIWSNRLDGTFIFSNPPAGIVNAQVRDWFKKAKTGETFVSSIYISSVTKKPCLTVSTPIIQENNIIGVVGLDITLSK